MKVKKVLLIYFISFVLISAGIGAVIYFDWYTQINATAVEEPPKYQETLTAVADFDYRPFSFIDSDGKVAGFDIDRFSHETPNLLHYIRSSINFNEKK